MTTIRTATVNLRAGQSKVKYLSDVNRITKTEPAVLGFAEIGGKLKGAAIRVALAARGMRLVRLDGPASAVPVAFRKSIYELVEAKKWDLSPATKVGKPGAGPPTLREKDATVLVLRRKADGAIHSVANFHAAPSIHLPVREELHELQMQRAGELVEAMPGERTIMGDWNTTDRSRLAPITSRGLRLPRKSLPTLRRREIDYIASDMDFVSQRTLGGLNTDHRCRIVDWESPLLTEPDVPKEPGYPEEMTPMDILRKAGFEVYTRSEWGSPAEARDDYAARLRSSRRLTGEADYHFLHITVTPDTDTKLEGFEGARKVESYGLSTPPQVSYQMLVTNEARIFEGQNYGVAGTHTLNDKKVPGFPENLNYYGYATAIMQNVDDEVTDEQVVAIAATFAASELAGLVKKFAPIYPHRMFDWKSCPGDKAVARLPEIQRLKDDMVRRGSVGTEEEDEMALLEEKLWPDRKDSPTVREALQRDYQAATRSYDRERRILAKLNSLRKDLGPEVPEMPAPELRRRLEDIEAILAATDNEGEGA